MFLNKPRSAPVLTGALKTALIGLIFLCSFFSENLYSEDKGTQFLSIKKDLISWADENSFKDKNLIHSLLYPQILLNLSFFEKDKKIFSMHVNSGIQADDKYHYEFLSELEKVILNYVFFINGKKIQNKCKVNLNRHAYVEDDYKKFSPELTNSLMQFYMISVLDFYNKVIIEKFIKRYRPFYDNAENIYEKHQILYHCCHVILVLSDLGRKKADYKEVKAEYDLLLKNTKEVLKEKNLDLFMEIYLALNLVDKKNPRYLDLYFKKTAGKAYCSKFYDDFSFNRRRHFYEVFLMAFLVYEAKTL